MKRVKYLVTNQSEGSICVAGRTRIEIPGLCSDLPVFLPEDVAKRTVSRLKQRYPLLKIREAGATDAAKGSTESAPANPAKASGASDDAAKGSTESAPATAQKSDNKKARQA